MRKLIIFGLMAIVVIFPEAFANKDETVQLRLKLKAGNTYKYQLTARLKNSIVPDSSDKRKTPEDVSKGFLDLGYEIKCLDVDDTGNFLVQVQYTDYKLKITSNVGMMERTREMDRAGIRLYNGDTIIMERKWDEVSDPNAPNIQNLLKTRFELRFDPKGTIVDYGNLKQMREKFPAIDFEQILSQQIVFPDAGIAIDAEWNNISEIELPEMPGNPVSKKTLVHDKEYRLSGIKNIDGRECAEVSVHIDSEFKGVDPEEVKLSQATDGVMLIDLSDGTVYSSKMDLNQKLEIKIEGQKVRRINTGQMTVKLVVLMKETGLSAVTFDTGSGQQPMWMPKKTDKE